MPDTTGTNATALDSLVDAVIDFSTLLDPMRLRIWDAEGLTVTQLRLLRFVSEKEGISNAELADRLFVTRPSVSALLDRLERGGFLRREIAPNDRRGICIWLEDKGRNAVTTLTPEGRKYMRGLFQDMSDAGLRDGTNALAALIEAGRERRRKELKTEELQER